MKKFHFSILLVLSAAFSIAQPYGRKSYPTGATLTSGYRTYLNGSANEGFIMTGMNGSVMHIDKTSTSGNLPSFTGPFSFQRNYTASQNGSCNTDSSIPVNLSGGASAIELLKTPNGAYYALAAAYSKGLFVTFLQPDGTVINTLTFPFPDPATQLNKPVIMQNASTKELYISGSYNASMYVIKLNSGGGLVWSSFYNGGNAVFMQPRDMIISSQSSEVVIVGHMSPNYATYGSASDGFFLALNPSTGNVNTFRNYTSTPCNWFNSIKNMTSGNGGVGYLVGGYTDYSINSGAALMMKLGLSGSIIWNTLITSGSPGIIANEIVGVVERQNTLGQWECYGVAQTYDNTNAPAQYSDFTIFKLNAAGTPASGTNEYHYTATASSQFRPINLSFKNSGTSDVGLQVLANNVGIGHYLLETCFNGVTGCLNENFTNIQAIEPGPNMVMMPITKFGALSMCNQITVTQVSGNTNPAQICSNTTPTGGSNARFGSMTGVTEGVETNEARLYPNPGNGLYMLEMNYAGNIKVFTILGEQVYENTVDAGKHNLDLVNYKNGIYFVKLFDGYTTKTIQLIKQ